MTYRRDRAPEIAQEMKEAAAAKRERKGLLQRFVARVFKEPPARPEPAKPTATHPKRSRPTEMHPQVKGGARIMLGRIDIASVTLRRSMRRLRRAYQRGELRGRYHAGVLYVEI